MKKNKKIILATALSGILSLGITGCEPTFTYSYQENESGDRELIGYLTPDDIDEFYIVNIKDREDNNYAYISRKYVLEYDMYYNIFNDQLICYGNNDENQSICFINEIPLFEYLAINNIQKGKYTADDLKTILDDYQEKKNQKILTK